MKFDLIELDFSQELSSQLILQHKKQIESMVESNERENQKDRLVTVFHGTTLNYLNNILLHGLVPRELSERQNYFGEEESNKHLVYLSNKWHYFYAYNAYANLKDSFGKAELNVPCYIECALPEKSLVMDEDFFHSQYIFSKIKDCIRTKERFLKITARECLQLYGTVAHIGPIARENIVSFTVLANNEVLYNKFISPTSRYAQELATWAHGDGVGKLTFLELLQLEDDKYNLTFQMRDIPPNHIIDTVLFDAKRDKYSLKFINLTKI